MVRGESPTLARSSFANAWVIANVFEEVGETVQHWTLRSEEEKAPQTDHPEGGRDGGHGHWLMLACCVPLVAIAVVLVATGVVSAGLLVAALACMAMMGAMMFLMMR